MEMKKEEWRGREGERETYLESMGKGQSQNWRGRKGKREQNGN